MTKQHRSFSKIFTLVFIGSFLIYGLFESFRYFSGPKITIIEPKDGAMIATSTVIVRGKVRNISYLTLNERQIFSDTSGNFGQKLLLQEGYNIINIEAKDRFGKNTNAKIELYRPIETKEDFEISTTTEKTSTTTDEIKNLKDKENLATTTTN